MEVCSPQSKYANDIIHKFGINSAKPRPTSMSPFTYIDKDERISYGEKRYRGMVAGLLYLIASRLDSLFSVCVLVINLAQKEYI